MSPLGIHSLHPGSGAQVEGFTRDSLFDDKSVSILRQTFDERGVLVFRDLDIDEETQRQLVYTLIRETPPDSDTASKNPWIVSNRVDNAAAPYGRLLFHCDTMWARNFEQILSLYGVEVQPPSAPTEFISMGDAWDRLPDGLRTRLRGLEARHGFEHRYPNRGGDDNVTDTYFEDSRSVIRPVGLKHPRTGRMLLYISQQATIEIVGLPPQENEALLAELFGYLYDPSAILHHEWQTGDLVVWDNIALQHGRGTVSLEGPERTLRKVGGPITFDADEVLFPEYSKVSGKASQ